MLGALVQGLEASNRLYSGGPFDWFTPFAVVCGFALIIGYALLGSTWLIIKTEHKLQVWARKVSSWILISAGISDGGGNDIYVLLRYQSA